MLFEWNGSIDKARFYRVKELGGKGRSQRGILGISYDSVIRKIVNNPLYADSITANWNEERTYRSNILIPGWVVIRWLDDNRLSRAA